MSSASRSPRARHNPVEPTTSVIMIVSVFASRLRSDNGCLPAAAHPRTLELRLRRYRRLPHCSRVTLLGPRLTEQPFRLSGIGAYAERAVSGQSLVQHLGGASVVAIASAI